MADVAKPEQATNTNATVETKEPQKVVENNATPVDAEKKESPVKEEKSETPVVNGDATAKDDKKVDTTPATEEPVATEKVKGDNFFTKLKKQMSFKTINILKKKKAPQEVIKENGEQPASTEKAEDTNKEEKATDDKKVEASPEKSDDKKRNKGGRLKYLQTSRG